MRRGEKSKGESWKIWKQLEKILDKVNALDKNYMLYPQAYPTKVGNSMIHKCSGQSLYPIIF